MGDLILPTEKTQDSKIGCHSFGSHLMINDEN